MTKTDYSKSRIFIAAVYALLAMLSSSKGHAQSLGPDGHYYQVVREENLLWEEARLKAAQSTHNGVNGHLATITSLDESDFINSLRGSGTAAVSVWIGGYQTTNVSSVATGWYWINGEGEIAGQNGAATFANWAGGEPSGEAQPYLALGVVAGWSSEADGSGVQGYVIEYPPAGTANVVRIVAIDPIATEPFAAGDDLDIATFEFHREGDLSEDLPVFFSVSGTAGNGDDYDEISRSLVIAAGESIARLNVIPRPGNPGLLEGMETVGIRIETSLILSTNAEYVIASSRREAAAVIFDFEPPAADALELAIPGNLTTYDFGERIVLLAALSSSNAVSAVDFYATEKESGVSNKIGVASAVPVGNDLSFFRFVWTNAFPGTYLIHALSATAVSHLFQIKVNEPTNTVVRIRAVAADNSSPWTDYVSGHFEIIRIGPTNELLQVHYLLGGTAAHLVDYEELTGYAAIGAGRTIARVRIVATDDDVHEGNEVVTMSLVASTNSASPPYVIDEGASQASLTIVDADVPPSLQVEGAATIVSDSAVAVEVQGSNAYIATVNGKLQVVDVSDVRAPRFRGEVQLADLTRPNRTMSDVKVSGNYAYVMGLYFWQNSMFLDSRLYVVDISNPDRPTLAGQVGVPGDYIGTRFELSVVGTTAYVACGANGLQIVDASNPAAPRIIGSHKPGDLVWDVEVIDGLAYLGAGANGLVIVDVTDPANTWRVGGAAAGYVYNIDVRGKYAFVAGEGDSFMRIFDISDPVAPQPVSGTHVGSGRSARGVTASANAVFLPQWWAGFAVYDITTPSAPAKATQIPTLGLADDIEVVGTIAYTAEREGGMRIFDVTDLRNPTLLGNYAIGLKLSGLHAIKVSSGYAYVRDLVNGIRIFDVRDVARPIEVGLYPLGSGVGMITIGGNLGYISTIGGFDVVDFTNPARPVKVGEYISGVTGIADVVVYGNYVYTSFGEIVNVSDPANPQFVGASAAFRVDIEFMEREGNFLYALRGYYNPSAYHYFSGVDIIDLSNPAFPVRRGSYYGGLTAVQSTELPFDMTVSDGIIYVARRDVLSIGDVRNPDAPLHVTSRTADAHLGGIAASGPRLYQGRNNLLDLLNVSEPSAPTLVDTEKVADTFGVMDIRADGAYAYGVGQGRNGEAALVIYSGYVGPPPNVPRLTALAEPGKVIVRWSTNFTGLKLYSTPRLGDPWQLVTSNVPAQGDSYSFTNTRPVGTSVFYKLSSN